MTTSLTDHTEEATEILKCALSQEYRSSSEPVFKCLWKNFNSCQFVEDEGMGFVILTSLIVANRDRTEDILYYKDRRGRNLVVD